MEFKMIAKNSSFLPFPISGDVISKTEADNIKEAILYFSQRKQLSVKEFSKLFKVIKS